MLSPDPKNAFLGTGYTITHPGNDHYFYGRVMASPTPKNDFDGRVMIFTIIKSLVSKYTSFYLFSNKLGCTM